MGDNSPDFDRKRKTQDLGTSPSNFKAGRTRNLDTFTIVKEFHSSTDSPFILRTQETQPTVIDK